MNNKELINLMAKDISMHVCQHIQAAYPEVWAQIKTSPKKSIKGCMQNALAFHLNQLNFTLKDIYLNDNG